MSLFQAADKNKILYIESAEMYNESPLQTNWLHVGMLTFQWYLEELRDF
jgi:hypothetical protein